MNNFKEKAFELRRLKKSYNEINKQLGIPKSTLSSWFKTDRQSLEVKKELIKKAQDSAIKKLKQMALANKEKWQKIHLGYRQNARKEFYEFLDHPLFAPGLLIYIIII
ncbi:MAG: helix-turn-helix domain containing protein [Patescibacteria group bacterium]|nr:helix-turn-helix domain containing protein [Patescibacteria group bacterium]